VDGEGKRNRRRSRRGIAGTRTPGSGAGGREAQKENTAEKNEALAGLCNAHPWKGKPGEGLRQTLMRAKTGQIGREPGEKRSWQLCRAQATFREDQKSRVREMGELAGKEGLQSSEGKRGTRFPRAGME